VPGKYQHRVLFWGIIGALIMRGAMIFLGAGLILKYQCILILAFVGIKMLLLSLPPYLDVIGLAKASPIRLAQRCRFWPSSARWQWPLCRAC